jgi:hypothetical protein
VLPQLGQHQQRGADREDLVQRLRRDDGSERLPALDPGAPGEGKTYPGPVTVKFTASDPSNEAGSTDPVSGINYIEHRVITNGAPSDWVRTNNPGIANPFSSSVTVTAKGVHTVEYRTVDRAGNTQASKSVSFVIYTPTNVDADVSGTVPSVLGLTLGSKALFGTFVPGVAQAYTASTTATVTSSWPDAKLSVFDPSATSPGRLMNGTSALTNALEVNGGGPFAAVGAATAPTTLKTYTAPVSNDVVPVSFRQSITATEGLKAGAYAKTLTFSLTTTVP